MRTILNWKGRFRKEVPPQLVGRYLPKVHIKSGIADVRRPARALGSLLLAQFAQSCDCELTSINITMLIECCVVFVYHQLHHRVQPRLHPLLVCRILIINLANCSLNIPAIRMIKSHR